MYDLKGADSVARDAGAGLYPAEFLNCIEVSGIPPHHLRLNVGMPVALLRNLNAAHGMCNGSKAIARRIRTRCVEAERFPSKNSGLREFTPPPPDTAIRRRPPIHFSPVSVPHAALLRK